MGYLLNTLREEIIIVKITIIILKGLIDMTGISVGQYLYVCGCFDPPLAF